MRLVVRSPYGGLLHHGRYLTFSREALRWRASPRSANDRVQGWILTLLADLEKSLGDLRFDGVTQRWTSYYDHLDLDAVAGSGDGWQQYYTGAREQALLSVLAEIPKGTLLDIGANSGFFSMLGGHFGFATTAVDSDVGAVDRLYRVLARSGASLPVRPLVCDFVKLERDHWPRFEADAVFALGFVHHMRRVELLPWTVIAERLAGLTRTVLVTEFKPGTGAANSDPEMTESSVFDYTVEHLASALRQYFRAVQVVGDFSAVKFTSARTMLVCRK